MREPRDRADDRVVYRLASSLNSKAVSGTSQLIQVANGSSHVGATPLTVASPPINLSTTAEHNNRKPRHIQRRWSEKSPLHGRSPAECDTRSRHDSQCGQPHARDGARRGIVGHPKSARSDQEQDRSDLNAPQVTMPDRKPPPKTSLTRIIPIMSDNGPDAICV